MYPRFVALPLLIAMPLQASAATGGPLEPQGPWKVDYADEECRLTRSFGSGDRALTLRLARGSSSRLFDTVLAGSAVPRLPQRVSIAFRLEPQGVEQTAEGYSLQIPKRDERFIRWFDANSDVFEGLQANQIVSIEVGDRFTIQLNLTQAPEAIKALDACYADLLKSWGADPAQVTSIAIWPKPVGGYGGANPGTVTAMRAGARPAGAAGWATPADYPSEALRQEIGGTVVMALGLDTTGKVGSCRVVVSSKFEPLDTKSCHLLTMRGRYTPALDAKGNAMPATVIERIRWLIPDD